ncbi:type 2 periplasmic-binding domain-containing protein [Dongshaea marina]|uniref:ABC transporter substrate-binding protein n=1 Tax=Dongshaea marina TaxID=2047966 RepID=UPI0018FFE88C|nr:ABC transporter substrate-binding protein [Dongshaea marina]
MWPYSIPIIYERVSVFCHEDVLAQSLRARWPEDYYGLIIGNNAGFAIGGDKFWKAVKKGRIKIQEVGGTRQNILKMGLKRIDCYINDRISILWELKKLKATGEYQEGVRHAKLLEGATISIEQGFLGFTDKDKGKFPYKTDFIKEFDTVIYSMRRTGELQEIIESYVR